MGCKTDPRLWIGIIIGEPIVNQLVRRLPVAKVLAYSMVVWSALVFGLAFAMSIPPVFAIRALLGFFESSFGYVLFFIRVWHKTDSQSLPGSYHRSMVHCRGTDIDHYSLAGHVWYVPHPKLADIQA